MEEEYIMEQVTTWFYEDIVNDILGLRRNVILAPNGEPCRYFIECKKLNRRVDNFRRHSVEAQMRYDKKRLSVDEECRKNLTNSESHDNSIDTENYNNSVDILCKSIATLSDLIERIVIHQDSVKKCDYRKIKSYFKEMTATGLEELGEMYQYYRRKSKDEILKIFNDKTETDKILNEVVGKIPQDKICIMYHYNRYHKAYNESIYVAFEKMFLKNRPCIYMMTTNSVDEIMEKVQSYLLSDMNVRKYYKEIYGHAIDRSKVYQSLNNVIPSEKYLKYLIQENFKIWKTNKKDKGGLSSECYKDYVDYIMMEIKVQSLKKITQKGKVSKYIDNYVNNMELRTLYDTFFSFIEVLFGLKSKYLKDDGKYICPEFILKEFIKFCENSYKEGIHKKKGTYFEAYNDKKYLEKIVKLYIGFFIMYVFNDKNSMNNSDFVKYINECLVKSKTEILLKYFCVLANEEKFEYYTICSEIINDILNHRN